MVGARAQESAIPTSGDHSAVRSAFALTGFLAASFVVAVIGSALSVTAISGWYDDLAKPMWTPPNTVFGSVWTVLYSSMAVAAWLVWRHPASTARRRALVAYVVSLIGASGLWIALGIIVALDFAILAAIIRFADISKPAAALLIPYWFWTLFATTLNAAIAVLAA